MFKKLPVIFAITLLVVICGAALIYGVILLRDENGGGLGGMLSKPDPNLYPYDLDTRPAAPDGPAGDLLPERIDSVTLAHAGVIPEEFLANPVRAIEAGEVNGGYYYSDRFGGAMVAIIRCDSDVDVKERLAILRGTLVEIDGPKTYRAELVGAHPYVKYRYGGWENAPHGLAWGNGEWLFFVFAETADALDEIAGGFPY